MDHGKLSNSENLAGSAPHVPPGAQPDHASSSNAMTAEAPLDRLAVLQQGYLLEQLAIEGVGSKSVGDLNKQMTAAAKRELQMSAEVANRVRRELAEQNYLEVNKKGRTVSYQLTDAGRAYLATLERPALSGRSNRGVPASEAAIPEELREAQKAYLLLQLLDADPQPLTKGNANSSIPKSLSVSLGLKPTIANYRRAKLAEQKYIRIATTGKSEHYLLTPDGLDYLAAGARHLEHATIVLKGKTLNALVAAARESSFERDGPAGPTAAERPMPSQTELAETVLTEFQELQSERHGHSGLVPIHEVRQRIVDRFGPAAGRHDVLDDVILGLWRENRLGLQAISDLGNATKQQLNEGIPGVNGTLFYLEVPREQPVAQ